MKSTLIHSIIFDQTSLDMDTNRRCRQANGQSNDCPLDLSPPTMDSGGHDGGGDPWWSSRQPHHNQQRADAGAAAAARLQAPAPLGPASQLDQPRRPNNKRGAAAASFATSRGSNDGNGEDDDDMMEEMESPEVRSFKRLKLEGGGYNHAGSGASFSHDAAAPQYGQGQYRHAGSGTITTNNYQSHAQQHQMVRLNSCKNSTRGFTCMRELILIDVMLVHP